MYLSSADIEEWERTVEGPAIWLATKHGTEVQDMIRLIEMNPNRSIESIDQELSTKGYFKPCTVHEAINVGFNMLRLACKHCDIDMADGVVNDRNN